MVVLEEANVMTALIRISKINKNHNKLAVPFKTLLKSVRFQKVNYVCLMQ